jgi:hypothetical protein
VLATGVLVPGAQALATGGPEAPLTDECVGVVMPGSVRICGILNPQTYAKAGYYFEYNEGAECTGGDTTPIEAEIEGQAIAVSAELTGLEPSTEYSYCLVATNPFGETVSHPAGSPAGPPTPETPVTEAANEVTRTTATLNGELNPHASAKAGYYFMYNTGASCAGGSRTPAKAEVEGERIAVSAKVTGLSPGTEYSYCLVATNPSGATFGQPVAATTLATASPPEAPITEACGGPSSPGVVRLCGTLNPHANAKVGYYFAYNTGASCAGGNKTPAEAEVEGKGIKVSSEVVGLPPGTEYTYCLVATNSHGETVGEGLTFKTEGEPIVESPPGEVQTEPAEQTVDGFKLKGKLNPDNSPTTYYFIYKKSGEVECEDLEGCGPETTHGGPLTGGTQQEVPPAEVTGLAPGTTYVYWLIARNAKGTVRGNELTFATPSADEPPEAPVTEQCTGLVVQGVFRLCGTLNPVVSAKVGYYFAYNKGESCTGGGKAPVGEEVEGQNIKVSGELMGLEFGAQYTYCLVATNPHGETFGHGLTFQTEAAPSTPFTHGSGQYGASSAPTWSGTSSTSGVTPPFSPLVTTVKPKALTRTQKLAKALKACEKMPKRLRTTCIKQANSKYGNRKGNHAITTKKAGNRA